MSRLSTAAAAALVTIVATSAAAASDYPARTVTLVVPYPPGGGVDAMARVVAAKLSLHGAGLDEPYKRWHQKIHAELRFNPSSA